MSDITVGILSIGEMGFGIARLLQAHGYCVKTVGVGRSKDTLERIRSASIELLQSDQDVVVQTDYILSIVPPRDALAIARRIADACMLPDTLAKRAARYGTVNSTSLQPCFIDLNAIPARLACEIEAVISSASLSPDDSNRPCHFLDGGIIGGPPSQDSNSKAWKKPSLVVSGTADFPLSFKRLAETLNLKIVSPKIGAASTLKLCFASLTKGLTALSILSFSTAEAESVLPELLGHLEEYSPSTAALATRGVVSMPPKAYRWIEEMRGIGEAFDTEGQWDSVGQNVFGSFAEVYRTVAEDTILGEEKVGKRNTGKTAEEVARIMANREQ